MHRKNLNADYLYSLVKDCFGRVGEHRKGLGNVKISVADALMSGLAVFALKKPSLLSFEESIRPDTAEGRSLRNLFSIDTPASDTQMRAILDPVCPGSIRAAFKKIFSTLQRGNALKGFGYLDGGYLVALDGTGHFSSGRVKCDDCIEKKHGSGATTYHHRLLGDALFSNAPFIGMLADKGLRYILGVKPDKHRALFGQFGLNKEHGLAGELQTEETIGERVKKRVKRSFRFLNGLSLNLANPDMKVNMLECIESTEYVDPADDKKNVGTKIKTFTRITDIELTEDNVVEVMAGGRARWKVENETFQTLKLKTAYNLEHSYGHGKKNLCTIFGMLAMLAFLIDQAQEIACPLFRKALEGKRAGGRKRTLWGLFKSAVEWIVLDTWETLLKLAAGIMEVSAVLEPAVDDSG